MSLIEQDILTLRSGKAGCTVAPEAGGAIAAFWWEAGERIDWLRPAGAAALAAGDAGGLGCFSLMPWGGRLRDGRFRFSEQEVVEDFDAASLSPHLRDGHGWRRPWRISERRPDGLVLDHLHEPGAWPWAYRARQSLALTPEALTLTLELENLSDAPMPAGLGFRPVLPRRGGATLRARTRGVWQTDTAGLPTCWTALSQESDLAAARPVVDLALDTVFTGWDGEAVVSWSERRCSLAIAAELPLLSFLGVDTLSDPAALALSAMSQCADAVNLARSGAADTGIRVLVPGARRCATMVLRPSVESA